MKKNLSPQFDFSMKHIVSKKVMDSIRANPQIELAVFDYDQMSAR